MTRKQNHTDIYVTSIVEDIQTRFVREQTVSYSDTEIERIYEFEDGAIVRYEWQSGPGKSPDQKYNHRFSLVTLPKPNPDKLKKGILRAIEFSTNAR